ncbi:hypothetical protein K439DRAFT_1357080, partial [Ramaria rubella]
LCWVPDHKGLDGNEHIDRKAKGAANGDSSPLEWFPDLLRKALPCSAVAAKCIYLSTTEQNTMDNLRKSLHFPALHTIDPSAPSAQF